MTRSREQRAHAERKARDRAAWRARRRHLAWASGPRCATCAYRTGTEASRDDADPGLTRLRRALLDAAAPFYCHERGPTPERRLCIGHMDAMSARHRAGYYAAHPPGAPEVAQELTDALAARERANESEIPMTTIPRDRNETP